MRPPLTPDGHTIPRVRDSWTFLQLDRCVIVRRDGGVQAISATDRMWVPCANLTALLLGNGTSITTAAVRTVTESGCTIVWGNDDTTRVLSWAYPQDKSSRVAEQQARLWSNSETRARVARAMYAKRFNTQASDLETLTIPQLRGLEGRRVRDTYKELARQHGVKWSVRSNSGDWDEQSPVNRGISVASTCVYGICHTALVALGALPALGFVHAGKQLSLVWDIGDLYKAVVALPAAFEAARTDAANVELTARRLVRSRIRKSNLLGRVINDVLELFELRDADGSVEQVEVFRGTLWAPDEAIVAGGWNQAGDSSAMGLEIEELLDDDDWAQSREGPF